MNGRVRSAPIAARSSLARSWYARASAMDSRAGTAAIIPAGSKRAAKMDSGHYAEVGLRRRRKRNEASAASPDRRLRKRHGNARSKKQRIATLAAAVHASGPDP